MITEKPFSSLPCNTVTLQSVKEQEMTSPIVMDEEKKTTQVPEEFSSPRLQEPVPNTSVVKEIKRNECLSENKSKF